MYNLTIKSVDVMKLTKDAVTNQLTTPVKTQLVSTIKTMGVTHIAHSIPMDDNSRFTANGTTPSPRTIEAEVQDWCDVIHTAGLNVIHRGTFCGVENIWNFAYDTSTSQGTASSAATDGNSTWCGRYYNYLYNHVGSHVTSGDVFAPIPEGTTHAFDGHFFISSGGSGATANYAQLFADFHTITNTYAAAQGVTVTFMSHNNYSEARSGWIPNSLFTNQGIVGLDYYGQYQGSTHNYPSDYVTDWTAIHTAKGVPLFWGEWGDINGNATPTLTNIDARMNYLVKFYKTVRDQLVDTGMMTGFNNWGGWAGQNTSLLYLDGNGNYQLNAWGQMLAAFYKSHAGLDRPPVTTGSGTSDHGSQHF